MQIDIQFVSILPDIIQLYDVRMIKKLHDADFAFQAEGYDFAASEECWIVLGILTEIRQTHRSNLLRRALGYDLGSSILSIAAVTHDTDPRTASLADSLAQLPRTNVGFSTATVGGVGASIGYLGIAFGVARTALVYDGGDSLVLG